MKRWGLLKQELFYRPNAIADAQQWYLSLEIHFSFSFYKFYKQSFLLLYYYSFFQYKYFGFYKFASFHFYIYFIIVLSNTIIFVCMSFLCNEHWIKNH